MMKKTSKMFLILTAVGICNPLLASGPQVTTAPKGPFQSGFNVAGSVGYGFGKAEMQSQVVNARPVGGFSYSTKNTPHKGGIVGSISLGYQHYFEGEWMVGGDLAFGLNPNKFSEQTKLAPALDMSQEIKSSWAFEPMISTGKKFEDKVSVFVAAGPSISQFKGSRVLSSPGRPSLSGNIKKTKVGFKGTIGAGAALGEKVSIMGSISYTNYGSVNASFPSTNRNPLAGDKNAGSFKVSAITPAVTVRYHF